MSKLNMYHALQAGIIDCLQIAPQGTPLIDLNKWAEDPERHSLFLASSIKLSLADLLPVDIDNCLQGCSLHSVFRPLNSAAYGKKFWKHLDDFFAECKWTHSHPNLEFHMRNYLRIVGMVVTLANDERYAVFMRLPIDPENMDPEDHNLCFESIAVKIAPDCNDWEQGYYSFPKVKRVTGPDDSPY